MKINIGCTSAIGSLWVFLEFEVIGECQAFNIVVELKNKCGGCSDCVVPPAAISKGRWKTDNIFSYHLERKELINNLPLGIESLENELLALAGYLLDRNKHLNGEYPEIRISINREI